MEASGGGGAGGGEGGDVVVARGPRPTGRREDRSRSVRREDRSRTTGRRRGRSRDDDEETGRRRRRRGETKTKTKTYDAKTLDAGRALYHILCHVSRRGYPHFRRAPRVTPTKRREPRVAPMKRHVITCRRRRGRPFRPTPRPTRRPSAGAPRRTAPTAARPCRCSAPLPSIRRPTYTPTSAATFASPFCSSIHAIHFSLLGSFGPREESDERRGGVVRRQLMKSRGVEVCASGLKTRGGWWAEKCARREVRKSLRIGVHHANAVVWGPQQCDDT